ncbi:hypothetical protein [Salinibacterium sp. ZJ77]|uniref:hypothetical protein n=1 Tax=Salinibacterium sp. ZJ77 TaxID=2708337 RepID=UPI00141E5011|nr:hypothetical protein [Salinibacterium sp. ZJ77]
MAKLDRNVTSDLVERIMAHISYQSAIAEPTANYQYLLPDGSYLTLQDVSLNDQRALVFVSIVPVSRPNRTVSFVLTRPRTLSQAGPWFSGWTDRQLRSARKGLAYAVRFAYANNDDDRLKGAFLIDPYAAPGSYGRRSASGPDGAVPSR